MVRRKNLFFDTAEGMLKLYHIYHIIIVIYRDELY